MDESNTGVDNGMIYDAVYNAINERLLGVEEAIGDGIWTVLPKGSHLRIPNPEGGYFVEPIIALRDGDYGAKVLTDRGKRVDMAGNDPFYKGAWIELGA